MVVFCLYAEILLFSQQPSSGSNYEYLNPCKYARRSETAVRSGDKRGGDDDSDSDDSYATIPLSHFTSPQPTTSSKQISSRPPKPVPANKPVKKLDSVENDSVQQPSTSGEIVIPKPCLPRPNLTQEKKIKEPAIGASSSATRTPANKQTKDDLTYELLELPSSVGGKAEGQTSKQDSDESSRKPAPRHEAYHLYAEVRVRPEPGKKQPPSTKPKTFKPNLVSASPSPSSADSGANSTAAVPRVNSVRPFVNTGTSVPSQSSSASPGHGKKYWKSARDVPTDLWNLSVEQVGECMELLHLPKLAADFRSQDVDGKLLINIISVEILETEFNCSPFKAKQVVQFVNGWRPTE